MTNDDNLQSNLLASSLLKRRLVYMMNWTKMYAGDLPLQVNYAVGRSQWQLQAIVLSGSWNLLVKEFNAGWLIILL